jgi:AcrR family transcriptional regulator
VAADIVAERSFSEIEVWMPKVSAAHEQAVRDRIVLAALRVFGERGFHRATMQDIVRESGLSIGAIYTYFAGKDELFLAGCDLTAGQELGELARRLAPVEDTAERLAVAVAFFLDSAEGYGAGPMAGYMIQAWAEAEQEPAVREMLVRRREQIVAAAEMLLQQGIARGDLPGWVDPPALARAASALLDGLLLQKVEEGPRWRRNEAERRARAIIELLLAATNAGRPEVPEVAAQPFEIGLPPARRSA